MAYPKIISTIQTILEDHKAEEISVLSLKGKSPFTDYYILATAINERSLGALADAVQEYLEENDLAKRKIEGEQESGWLIIDAGDAVVHLFLEWKRRELKLDELVNSL